MLKLYYKTLKNITLLLLTECTICVIFNAREVIDMEENKRNRLLTSAYNLFIHKGINKTTIQDIVDAARVAKGTFYLYFEDKYKLQEELVVEKSKELFNNALDELSKHKIKRSMVRI